MPHPVLAPDFTRFRGVEPAHDPYLSSARMGAYSGEAFGAKSHGLSRRRRGWGERAMSVGLQAVAVLAFIVALLAALVAVGAA